MATKHTSTTKTATAAASDAVSTNGNRKVLIIQPTDGAIYLRTDGQDASASGGSILLASGRAYIPGPDQVPSDRVSIIRAGASNVTVTVVEG